jgi:hypothetical protein
MLCCFVPDMIPGCKTLPAPPLLGDKASGQGHEVTGGVGFMADGLVTVDDLPQGNGDPKRLS